MDETNILNKLTELYTTFGNSVKLTNNLFSRDAWLWIDKQPDNWIVTLTNGKTSHYAGSGPAFMIDVCNKTGVTTYWYKANLWLTPVYDEEERNFIDSKIRNAIIDFHNKLSIKPKTSFWSKLCL